MRNGIIGFGIGLLVGYFVMPKVVNGIKKGIEEMKQEQEATEKETENETEDYEEQVEEDNILDILENARKKMREEEEESVRKQPSPLPKEHKGHIYPITEEEYYAKSDDEDGSGYDIIELNLYRNDVLVDEDDNVLPIGLTIDDSLEYFDEAQDVLYVQNDLRRAIFVILRKDEEYEGDTDIEE